MNNDNWDYIFKIFLMCTALYFLLHIGFALAQTQPTPPPPPPPPPPVIQCWNNGFGTVQCAPL